MMKSKEIAIASVIASLYAITVIMLPSISFLLFQVRIADALIPLSMILGWPAILGITIGCFVANFSAPWGQPFLVIIDAFFGSIANLIAGYVSWKLYRNVSVRVNENLTLQLGCFVENIIVTLIVGTYLKYLLEVAFGIKVPLLVSWFGILLGSLVSINLLGYSLALAVHKVLSPKSKR